MKYILITWPEVQELLIQQDFLNHACLANSIEFVNMYGSSAYFVELEWLDKIKYQNLMDSVYAPSEDEPYWNK